MKQKFQIYLDCLPTNVCLRMREANHSLIIHKRMHLYQIFHVFPSTSFLHVCVRSRSGLNFQPLPLSPWLHEPHPIDGVTTADVRMTSHLNRYLPGAGWCLCWPSLPEVRTARRGLWRHEGRDFSVVLANIDTLRYFEMCTSVCMCVCLYARTFIPVDLAFICIF